MPPRGGRVRHGPATVSGEPSPNPQGGHWERSREGRATAPIHESGDLTATRSDPLRGRGRDDANAHLDRVGSAARGGSRGGGAGDEKGRSRGHYGDGCGDAQGAARGGDHRGGWAGLPGLPLLDDGRSATERPGRGHPPLGTFRSASSVVE